MKLAFITLSMISFVFTSCNAQENIPTITVNIDNQEDVLQFYDENSFCGGCFLIRKLSDNSSSKGFRIIKSERTKELPKKDLELFSKVFDSIDSKVNLKSSEFITHLSKYKWIFIEKEKGGIYLKHTVTPLKANF